MSKINILNKAHSITKILSLLKLNDVVSVQNDKIQGNYSKS